MTRVLMVALLCLPFAAEAHGLKAWWRGFCERNLIADDPYQFEHLVLLPDEQLAVAKRALARRLHEMAQSGQAPESTLRVYRAALMDVIRELEERKMRVHP